MQQVTILGSTGSVGTSTLDVLARHPDRYQVFALTAHRNIAELQQQVMRFQPRYAVLADSELAVNDADWPAHTELLRGPEALDWVASAAEVDTVMAAIVGGAGLGATLAAAAAGKKVLLANKESLVMAGPLFMSAVREGGATLLPIDSEHNAMFQCLPLASAGCEHPLDCGVSSLLLTGSGGPFRERPLAALSTVTPEEACAHPNWDMGRKISVDSATMMNKGLELIEACYLFNTAADTIDVVIHPQSIIHSMVQYVDGSVLAQLGNPDMRTPIAHALAWPERIEAGVAPLDIIAAARLDFEAPDEQRFPGLALARQAVVTGHWAVTTLNAANEVAVAAFLDGRLSFTGIPVLIDRVLQAGSPVELPDLEAVKHLDAASRDTALTFINDIASGVA